jgi:hypothetical protein
VLTRLQSLTKAVVEASQKPELLLLVSVGVVGGVAHHLHEVVIILLHPHRTLRQGAKLLSLLDHQLAGQVLLAERLAELQPGDESWDRVVGEVVVPPRLGRTLQLLRSDGEALLVSANGEVELGLHHPQLLIGVEQTIRIAEGRGLQADEPLELLRDVLVWRGIAVPTVASVLHVFRHPLH